MNRLTHIIDFCKSVIHCLQFIHTKPGTSLKVLDHYDLVIFEVLAMLLLKWTT